MQDKKPRSLRPNYQMPISRIHPVKVTGRRYYLQHARGYSILGCWGYENWEESGITPVIIAYQQAEDKVIFSVCLVDLHCLGVMMMSKKSVGFSAHSNGRPGREITITLSD